MNDVPHFEYKRKESARNGGNIMELVDVKNGTDFENLTQILDRGIDDMESDRELPLEDAFDLIAELVERRERARA